MSCSRRSLPDCDPFPSFEGSKIKRWRPSDPVLRVPQG
uniref:Uncharacterized protein n=1 Tax=Zea mays TaxID=4577 RepID=B6T608_MAIZE|nr:hypothetical protein [Zea mays]